MAQATNLPSSLPSMFVLTPISVAHGLSSRIRKTSSCRPSQLSGCKQTVTCHMTREKNEESTSNVNRRFFAITGAVLVSSVLYTKDAHAGKRKPPVPEQETKPKNDPNMSALRAKELASARRKEALKASLSKLKGNDQEGNGSSSTDE
uniref:Uncharacterized protein n=1 Tax=Picea sitchensis TaxID=3332 RepID=A9NR34_PICSI|nr:unknown [Picea sitchensis]